MSFGLEIGAWRGINQCNGDSAEQMLSMVSKL